MIKYLNGVFREFKYIRWLPVNRAFSLSILCIIISIIIGFLLGAFDNFMTALLRNVII